MPEPIPTLEASLDAYASATDADALAALTALPPLVDEDDASWDDPGYWAQVAYPYIALAILVGRRRLVAGIPLLLERACYGDPSEIMRGLRHHLEAACAPDWRGLADLCLAAADSPRPGTRLWALDQLAVLEDPRARPAFQRATWGDDRLLRQTGQSGLERLDARDRPS